MLYRSHICETLFIILILMILITINITEYYMKNLTVFKNS